MREREREREEEEVTTYYCSVPTTLEDREEHFSK